MSADSNSHYDKQRRHGYHQTNLQNPEREGEAAEILRALSEINDLPIQPKQDPVMGQLVSKLTSTANLSADEVRSNEWVREYILILYLCKFPRQDGMHSTWRAWSHNDDTQARSPLDPETRAMLEAFVTTSKLGLSRSEDAKVIEESVRNVSESIVNEENQGQSSGNGLLGKVGLK